MRTGVRKVGSLVARSSTTTSNGKTFKQLMLSPADRGHRLCDFRWRHYTVAITRELPSTFEQALRMDASSANVVDVDKAVAQHENYVQTLRTILPTLSIPPSEDHPDCPFVEDSAVVVGRRAVVTRMGASSRRGEEEAIRTVLESLGIEVILDMTTHGSASVDGGDVLHPVGYHSDSGQNKMGRHLFVGISNRTNIEGYQLLKKCLEGSLLEVNAVQTPMLTQNYALHLKSVVTHLDDETLVAPTGPLGDTFLQAMNAEHLGYKVIRVPSLLHANLVSVNGSVLVQPGEGQDILYREVVIHRGWELHYVDASEFAKVDGALTCKSILVDV